MNSISSKRLINIIKQFSRTRVLVVGDIMLDEYIWGKVVRISPEAPVPVVDVHHETVMPGGAANVARNIKAVGCEVSLCGVVGKDERAACLKKIFREEEIDDKGVAQAAGFSTILKSRVIAHSQQVVRIDREKNREVSADVLKKIFRYARKSLKQVDGVVIEDYGKGVVTQELAYFFAENAGKNNKPLVVDPKKGRFLDYTGASSATPNMEEALAFAGLEYNGEYSDEKVEEAGNLLLKQWGMQSALVTLGEHGMSLFESGKPLFRIPALAREVYDVSGAGDTVAGIFTAAICAGASHKEAALLANIAAGVVVGKVGTAVVTAAELKDAVKNTLK